MKKFKSGAASFYIVVIATLLFSVIAISFSTLIVSEIRRTSNSDLSQSAYDSALAGIEDAKSAYLSYQSCINQGYTTASGNACAKIIGYMEAENPDCDMVAHILGRAQEENGEVMIEESNISNAMNQAYTCVIITQSLADYRSTLNSANPSRLVKVNLDNLAAEEVTSIRLSWYSDNDGTNYRFTNFDGTLDKVSFTSRSSVLSTPPTVSIQLIQTAVSFDLDDFETTVGNQTDRGTLFLVPTNDPDAASTSGKVTYSPAYSTTAGVNTLSAEAFLKSNDKTSENLPYAVYCPDNSSSEFACSISIELPGPIGDGSRNDDTFAFILTLPYGGPDTDFSLAFCTGSGICTDADLEAGTTRAVQRNIRGGQIKIDSTGRANDLFRRVEARIDTYDSNYTYPEYAIELLGHGTVLTKNIVTTCEFQKYSNFEASCY